VSREEEDLPREAGGAKRGVAEVAERSAEPERRDGSVIPVTEFPGSPVEGKKLHAPLRHLFGVGGQIPPLLG
jgi:hypothetical protein